MCFVHVLDAELRKDSKNWEVLLVVSLHRKVWKVHCFQEKIELKHRSLNVDVLDCCVESNSNYVVKQEQWMTTANLMDSTLWFDCSKTHFVLFVEYHSNDKPFGWFLLLKQMQCNSVFVQIKYTKNGETSVPEVNWFVLLLFVRVCWVLKRSFWESKEREGELTAVVSKLAVEGCRFREFNIIFVVAFTIFWRIFFFFFSSLSTETTFRLSLNFSLFFFSSLNGELRARSTKIH